MKLTLSLAVMVLPLTLLGQTVIHTKEMANTYAEYHVLKSDTNVKQGSYREFTKRGHILSFEGFFNNNKKDSLWTYYAFSKVCEKGYYKDDKKVGVWDVYDTKGYQELQYDYTNRTPLYIAATYNSDKPQHVINGHDTVEMQLDHTPIYLDGLASIYWILATNIKYPFDAKEANIQGRVLVGLTIDSLGRVSNVRIEKGIGHGCDEETLRVVKLIDGDWLPAQHDGKPVTVEYTLPVSFVIKKQ